MVIVKMTKKERRMENKIVGTQTKQIYFTCRKHDLEQPCQALILRYREKREFKGENLDKMIFIDNLFHLE